MAAAWLLAVSPLYIAMGPPPSLHDASAFADYVARNNVPGIATKLGDTAYVICFIVFASALRRVIRSVCPDDWEPDAMFASALVAGAVVLIGDVLAGAASLDTFKAPDVSAVRALTEASLFAFGPVGFFMTALFLAVTSYALVRSQVLGRAVVWFGLAVAALNLAAVPAVFKGNDFMEVVIAGGASSSGPYSYISSIAGLGFTVWLLMAGVSLWRSREP